jgi:CRISPR-associated endoribonuclease Cas6
MRFKLTLTLSNPKKRTLPLNYQYELSSWIYHVLNSGSPEFATWLHGHGYCDDRKQFRMFTFSNLDIPQRRIQGDRLEILSREISMIVSMLPDEMNRHFITGLFQDQSFILGDRLTQVPLQVISIEGLAEPVFSGRMSFTALSPLLISFKYPDDRYARYFAPNHPDYPALFFRNLNQKHMAFFGAESHFDEKEGGLEILSEPRKKGTLIKAGTPMESKIIGYRYDFRLAAPKELLRFGYYTGFGEKNSMGFGCGEVKNNILSDEH